MYIYVITTHRLLQNYPLLMTCTLYSLPYHLPLSLEYTLTSCYIAGEMTSSLPLLCYLIIKTAIDYQFVKNVLALTDEYLQPQSNRPLSLLL